jgi:hypothetical protein
MTLQKKLSPLAAQPQPIRTGIRESFSKLDDDVLLSEQECAEICGFAVITLEKWCLAKPGEGRETTPGKPPKAKPGQGPKATYIHGNVRYRVKAVREWLDSLASSAA